MLARSDQVFPVEVRGVEQPEQGQVAALALIEAADRLLVGAGGGFHEFDPSIVGCGRAGGGCGTPERNLSCRPFQELWNAASTPRDFGL